MNIPSFAPVGTVWLGGPDTSDADGWFEVADDATWTETGVLDPPLVIGDSTRASQRVISSMTWFDLSGGIGIDEENEASDTSRVWFGAMDVSHPGQVTLPPEVNVVKPDGATGTCWPLGRVGETMYALFGTSIKGWKEKDGVFYGSAATGLAGVPSGKPVWFKGKLFVPYGSLGYQVLTESGTPGTLNAPTNVTTGIGVPAAYDASALVTTPPKPVAFCVWDQKLWALTTSGAVCWSKTGLDDYDAGVDFSGWTWMYDQTTGQYAALESGQVPKTLFTYRNAVGQESLYATSTSGLFILDDIAKVFRNTPLRDFPANAGFGSSSAKWRVGEDCWVNMGLDVYHWSPEGTVVPLSGPCRDHGLPQKYAGRVADLCADLSGLYMLVQGGTQATAASSPTVEDRGAVSDDASYVPATVSAPCLLRWTGIGYVCDWAGETTDGAPTWAVVGDVATTGGVPVDGQRLWWGSSDGFLRNIKISSVPMNAKELWRSGRGRYAPASSLLSARTDCGISGFTKVASGFTVECDNASATSTVTVAYQTREMEVVNPDWFVDLGTVSSTDPVSFGFKGDADDPYFSGVPFSRIRFRWTFRRDPSDPSDTPVMASSEMAFLKVPKTTTAPIVSVVLPTDRDRFGRSAQDVVDRLRSRVGPRSFSVLVIGDQTYRGWVTGTTRRGSTGKLGDGAMDVNFVQIKTGVPGAAGES